MGNDNDVTFVIHNIHIYNIIYIYIYYGQPKFVCQIYIIPQQDKSHSQYYKNIVKEKSCSKLQFKNLPRS